MEAPKEAKTTRPILADDRGESVWQLFTLRFPWLILGGVGGMLTTLYVASFESQLSANIKLAFFIPLIIYMGDAMNTQTETIFVRNLSRHKTNFFQSFAKELLLGILMGGLTGIAGYLSALALFHDGRVALAVGLAIWGAIVAASVLALIPPTLMYKEHRDPAVGAGPISTVLQGLASITIYFLISGWLI